MILNLAINAQDAMPHGGNFCIETAEVELDESYASRKKGVRPGPYVMLAVSDTGTGMDTETLKNIFEPFFTTKEKGSGTGLGMATAYGIVKQHGGNIWAYSEPDMGTTIKVYLPVSAELSNGTAASPQKDSSPRGSETILLAEDDRQVRNLASTVLKRYGYRVLEADRGQEALSILENHDGPVHLLLTDLIMPDTNGKELFARVASSHPYVKVLYMSGYTDDVISHHGVLDYGVDFIEKPFNIKSLAAVVREVLDQ